ncbi:MAG TPA: hypothetical protein VGC57_06345, partial [Cellulomonas sp.]
AEDGPYRDWLVLHRGGARVVVNLADEERTIPLDVDGLTVRAAWSGCRLVSGVGGVGGAQGAHGAHGHGGGPAPVVVLDARSVAVLA